jgi:hypothetical protein
VAALASTAVSMSVAITRADPALSPSASISVMASEYGSSPVEAAAHQMVTGCCAFRTWSASVGK